MTITKKKLIEVALPLEAINTASVREGYIYRGNPSALHKWWAQRPLAAARAVLFAQMVDDPSANPDLFKTAKAQEKERQRLFRIIEDLVKWENTNNEEVLQKAREEIWQSWRRACAQNADHPRAKELFNRNKLPPFHDPFAGGGTIPLEAQRLGFQVYASDLNPVAVVVNKATVEFPAKFSNRSPINVDARGRPDLVGRRWGGADGLAEDVRHYGEWVRNEARRRIGKLYPDVEVTPGMINERPDLKAYVGKKLTVIAWLWARTVKSPNPAFANVEVPLASTFMLSTKPGKEAYVEPAMEYAPAQDLAISDGDLVGRAQKSAATGYRLTVKTGKPTNLVQAKNGTKLSRANFACVMSAAPISADYIKAEGQAGRMGARLLAIVADGERGRVYLTPTSEHEAVPSNAQPEWRPEGEIPKRMTGGNCTPYGLNTWGDLFTPRQLVALNSFSDLVAEAIARALADAIDAGLPDDGVSLCDGGTGAKAYAEAIGVYLALAQDKTAEYGCTIVPWYSKEDRPKGLFARQAIPMVWDYAEVNPLCDIGGTFSASVNIVAGALAGCAPTGSIARVVQHNAVNNFEVSGSVVSTDPPYYDNIGYADLSDFFYVWMRRGLRPIFPDLFATMAVPKKEELVATPYRHGSKEKAEAFFLDGMTEAMRQLASQSHPAFPVSIYYAFKQSENQSDEGTASTGWETFLDAVIRAGFGVNGTWPIRTERGARSIGIGSNALASSIVLVCRKLADNAATATRREFLTTLKAELPAALAHLQAGNIAPVDLAQAAIGPGMAIFTRYAKVIDSATGRDVTVREALTAINEVLDQALAEQEGDFDGDTRWALSWFEQYGFSDGEYGVAETLAKAKNIAIGALADDGILESKRGKVRLFKPAELPADWDPATDKRLTTWEMVHHLIRLLESGGESAAAVLVAKLGGKAEVARELAYRLYVIAERKKRAGEALSYNGLVQSWPEIQRLASEVRIETAPAQGELI